MSKGNQPNPANWQNTKPEDVLKLKEPTKGVIFAALTKLTSVLQHICAR